jgi:hypothetical protein
MYFPDESKLYGSSFDIYVSVLGTLLIIFITLLLLIYGIPNSEY